MEENNTQNEQQEPAITHIPAPAKRSRVWLNVAGALIIGLIVGGVVVGVNSGSDDSTQSANTEHASENQNAQQESTQTTTEGLQQKEYRWSDVALDSLQSYDEQNDNVTITYDEDFIYIRGNGIPDHETGEFPNSGNPNSISEQDIDYTIPRNLVYTGEQTSTQTSAVSIGGVDFDPGTAERDQTTGWNIEAFNSGIFAPGTDENNAHVQPDGTYHYHGLPTGLVDLSDHSVHSDLIGFAADGFPLYAIHGYEDAADSSSTVIDVNSSWQLKQGQRQAGGPTGSYNGDYTQDYEFVEGSGHLDECNGRFTVTPEFPEGVYAYYVTENFPYVGRCVNGEMADSFMPPQGMGAGTGGGQGQPSQGGGPPSSGMMPPPPQ